MEHLDLIFMMLGIGYTCYWIMELLLKLEYRSRRRRRKS